MPRDLSTYARFRAWYVQRQRRLAAWQRVHKTKRYEPFRRTGPAPQWHPDSYSQPGEVE